MGFVFYGVGFVSFVEEGRRLGLVVGKQLGYCDCSVGRLGQRFKFRWGRDNLDLINIFEKEFFLIF